MFTPEEIEDLKPIPPDGILEQRHGFDGSGGDYITGTGQLLGGVHPASACVGRHCVIHDPSDHSMRSYPTHWREGRAIMERICTHGVGHPDPDDMAYHDIIHPGHLEGVHGCDGCCRK